MGADHKVHLAGLQFLYDLVLLPVCAEAREHLHVERIAREAVLERVVVLVGEYGRGYQHRGLFAFLQTFEYGSGGDLRLAVAHVSAEQPVHGDGPLHVLLYLFRAAELVLRLLIREGVLELPLPYGVRAELVTLRKLPLRGQLYVLLRHVLDGGLGSGLGLLPFRAGEPVDLRLYALGTHVFLDVLQLVHGHVENVRAGVLDLKVVHGAAVHGKLFYACEAPHAVSVVHHVVALLYVRKDFYLRAFSALAARLLAPCEDVVLGKEDFLFLGEDGAADQRSVAQLHLALKARSGQELLKVYEPVRGLAGDGHFVSFADEMLELALEVVHVACEHGRLPGLNVFYGIQLRREPYALGKRRAPVDSGRRVHVVNLKQVFRVRVAGRVRHCAAALLQRLLYYLFLLFFIEVQDLAYARRVVRHYDGGLGEIFEYEAGPVVEVRHEALQILVVYSLLYAVQQVVPAVRDVLHGFSYRGCCPGVLRFAAHHELRRIDADGLRRLRRPLRHGVVHP